MKKFLIGGAILFFLALIVGVFIQPTPRAQASVNVTGEYYATTTSQTYGITNEEVLKTCVNDTPCPTTLGSVIVTASGTGGGNINFYDATTTNVDLRTGNKATSTLLKASLPNGIAVGTYIYDTLFTTGVLVDYEGGGTIATTTITYR